MSPRLVGRLDDSGIAASACVLAHHKVLLDGFLGFLLARPGNKYASWRSESIDFGNKIPYV
jgi:hypothetical protein